MGFFQLCHIITLNGSEAHRDNLYGEAKAVLSKSDLEIEIQVIITILLWQIEYWLIFFFVPWCQFHF